MMNIHYMFLQLLLILINGQLSQSSFLPIYNPITNCHDLTHPTESITFAFCLQRASNKQHPYNLFTSPSFCSKNYPSDGRLVDLSKLSPTIIDFLFESLTNLLNSADSYIQLPEPNFFWISSTSANRSYYLFNTALNSTPNVSQKDIWCPEQCQEKNRTGQYLILKTRCFANGTAEPCVTTKTTHWNRAPFICVTNQTRKQSVNETQVSNHVIPTYPNDTIIFYDSTPCLIVRTSTHQYTFCFRRQSCPKSQTSAFCTTRENAYRICQEEKDHSNLLTIESDDEYRLVNDIIYRYSNETLLNSDGTMKNKFVIRAQWMWIDGRKSSNDNYFWNTSQTLLTLIPDGYWCNNMMNCSGGKGRDYVVLNTVCRENSSFHRACLATRRHSEAGPFICKRTLRDNEDQILNYSLLANKLTDVDSNRYIDPIYDKNSTSIYYDEHHCLSVQTVTHLYTFCLRRQDCVPTKAYCTKWSKAQNECKELKNQAQLLTIDNEQEQLLITDIVNNYLNETRLTFNGNSSRYFNLADFIWIDGVQQDDNETYSWKNTQGYISDELWCPIDKYNRTNRERAMLNTLYKRNQSKICLGKQVEWKPAPYVCKRIRPFDSCPILFDDIRYIKSNEMLIVTVNRTIALIKCKLPKYNTEIKVQYQCDTKTKQWKLIYKNDEFNCPSEDISTTTKISTKSIAIPIQSSSTVPTISNVTTDCSQSDLATILHSLPTNSTYVNFRRIIYYSRNYYDMKLMCSYDNLIHITYRCDLETKQWIYVYGHTNRFNECSPTCYEDEASKVINKYFTSYQQRQIRVRTVRRNKSLRLRCFNSYENRWKSILYVCGTMAITKYQWFKLNSCFQPIGITTTLPTVMVAMSVNDSKPSCSPPVVPGSRCEFENGEYIFDTNGCPRKICPSLSQLCFTIRCPPDRVCRVTSCKSCVHTDYLQAVCDYPPEPTLCQLERQLFSLNDYESISDWQHRAIVTIQKYANEKRQQLRLAWPVLTVN